MLLGAGSFHNMIITESTRDLFDKCSCRIAQLLRERKLYIKQPYRCLAQHYFVNYNTPLSGVTVSTVEGEAGMLSRAWGIVFIDVDKPQRCTDIHTSYYGESVALGKLFKELKEMI